MISLRRRFIVMGFVNFICAPFIFVYLLLVLFYRYFAVSEIMIIMHDVTYTDIYRNITNILVVLDHDSIHHLRVGNLENLMNCHTCFGNDLIVV
jgi:hypothetical protein